MTKDGLFVIKDSILLAVSFPHAIIFTINDEIFRFSLLLTLGKKN